MFKKNLILCLLALFFNFNLLEAKTTIKDNNPINQLYNYHITQDEENVYVTIELIKGLKPYEVVNWCVNGIVYDDSKKNVSPFDAESLVVLNFENVTIENGLLNQMFFLFEISNPKSPTESLRMDFKTIGIITNVGILYNTESEFENNLKWASTTNQAIDVDQKFILNDVLEKEQFSFKLTFPLQANNQQ